MASRELFIRGIFESSITRATNGVECLQIVPRDHAFNAIGEKADPSGGCISGPIVVRPIYHGVYEEIKYAQQFMKTIFHCITGTPGVGKSFMAPFLAKRIMEDDEDAILAYWNKWHLYFFSKKPCAGFFEQDNNNEFFHKTVPRSDQVDILHDLCERVGERVYIIRDPPREPAEDDATDMAHFDGAKLRILIASYDCYLIPGLVSKGKCHFHYVKPFDIDEIEKAYLAGLIWFSSNENETLPIAPSQPEIGTSDADVKNTPNEGSTDDREKPKACSVADRNFCDDGEKTKAISSDVDDTAIDNDVFLGLTPERKSTFFRVRQVYENAQTTFDTLKTEVCLSAEEERGFLVLHDRFAVVGGSLRTLLSANDRFAEIKEAMQAKVESFFKAPFCSAPATAPSFIDKDRYYGNILHKLPNEKPSEGSPLGLFHSYWRWASPYVENLAVDQVLQNTRDFADRFFTIMGSSGNQSTYASMFEGQCHRNLSTSSEKGLTATLRVLIPDGAACPDLAFEWRCKSVHHFSTQSSMGRLRGIGEGTYCKPFVVNFPTADSFAIVKKTDFYGDHVKGSVGEAPLMVVAFQMTVSDSQSQDPKPSHIVRIQDEIAVLNAVQHQLGGGKSVWSGPETAMARRHAIAAGTKLVDRLALVFLVPSHCVQRMKFMPPLTRQDAPRVNHPTGIDKNQYVMTLDNNWDASLKTFVDGQERKRRRT